MLRRDWAAAIVFALLAGPGILPPTPSLSAAAVVLALAYGVLRLFVLMRVGLVASILTVFVMTLLTTSPITARTSEWYASIGYAVMALTVALSLYGFRFSLGGRPILGFVTADD